MTARGWGTTGMNISVHCFMRCASLLPWGLCYHPSWHKMLTRAQFVQNSLGKRCS